MEWTGRFVAWFLVLYPLQWVYVAMTLGLCCYLRHNSTRILYQSMNHYFWTYNKQHKPKEGSSVNGIPEEAVGRPLFPRVSTFHEGKHLKFTQSHNSYLMYSHLSWWWLVSDQRVKFAPNLSHRCEFILMRIENFWFNFTLYYCVPPFRLGDRTNAIPA